MARPLVKIGINPHWYSQFWIKQFWQLHQRGEIRLRPLFTRLNPPACFYFEIEGRPCLIDVYDRKETQHNPADYWLYFKANFSPAAHYLDNVRPCFSGTTLKRANKPVLAQAKPYDIVFMSSISGGRHHKVALFEALASLPLRSRLVVKMVTPHDTAQWGTYLRSLGVEVITETWPYRVWLDWQKKGRWCVLTRGKHDCLSFKMMDYCSLGAAVLADYAPTTRWAVPVEAGVHFISLGIAPFAEDEMAEPDFKQLRADYRRRAHEALPVLQDESLRARIAANNLAYFRTYIADGRAARYVIAQALAVAA
ncbi:MAG: hypothetical protein HY372_02230 [Candidatus Andersenbacteria bacterium]|nr:hypothetical protein [Candidatus Andersenbacteria bacterium]